MIERDQTECIISGSELSERMEGLFIEFYDQASQHKRYIFADSSKRQEFERLQADVKAVYRATAEEKLKFVSGLQELTYCSYTGKSPSDVNVLGAASVGFALGQVGCDVVRQESDIVLLDDNFNSIFNAVCWGRNVFDNVRKFLQFQLTVNVSCLWIVILGGASLGMSPFSILQLLWINLIMDILAAIAMASEAPVPGELRAERVNLKEDPLISRSMWSAIYSQLIYQVLVMTTLLYAAPAMFKIEYNLVTTPLYLSSAEGVEGGATYRLQHYTFLFQTFMLMNLFNMLNCRVLPTEKDP